MTEQRATSGRDRRFVLKAALAGGAAAVLAPGVFLIAETQAREPAAAASTAQRWGLLIDVSRCAEGCTRCVDSCRAEQGWEDRGLRRSRSAMDSPDRRLRPTGRGQHHPARHVPALRRSALRRCLPDRRLVPPCRRHRAGGPASVHRLPLLRDGLSARCALLRGPGPGETSARPRRAAKARRRAARCASTASMPDNGRPASRPVPVPWFSATSTTPTARSGKRWPGIP